MWPREIVEAFPFGQFSAEINIVFVSEQLIEFLFIGSVGTFNLAVELRGTGLDVDVTDALVLDMQWNLA